MQEDSSSTCKELSGAEGKALSQSGLWQGQVIQVTECALAWPVVLCKGSLACVLPFYSLWLGPTRINTVYCLCVVWDIAALGTERCDHTLGGALSVGGLHLLWSQLHRCGCLLMLL